MAKRWHKKVTVSAGQTSDPVIVPEYITKYSLSALVAATVATGRLEVTISSPEAVQDGSAKWLAWASGDVTVDTWDTVTGLITAVRGVSTANAFDFEILGA